MSFLTGGGHRLEYQWIRPGKAVPNAPALVFLHEGLGSVALWKKFPRRVVHTTGCPALVYSRYGYGKSDRLTAPRAVGYMHREALEVLPEILEQLEIHDPILIGHSDGASIALIYAGSGGHARALVLMAPHVLVEDLTVQSIAQAKSAYENTDMRTRLGRYHNDVDSTFCGWNDIWLHPDFRSWNIEEYLPRVHVPLLLVQGEDDQYGTLAQIRSIDAKARGRIKLLLLPQCGHSPHVDQSEATLSAIARFVTSLNPRMRRPKAPASRC